MTLGRPKGSKQLRDQSKYWLPEGVTLKSEQPDYYLKETKLIFVDIDYGDFESTFKALQGANKTLHPRKISERKSANNPGASDTAKSKRKATMILKYGVANALENPEFTAKSRATLLKNHGVEHNMQSNEIREKMIQNNLRKYGVENVMQHPEHRQSLIDSCMARYGVPNGGGSELAKAKILESFTKRGFRSVEETELANFIESFGFKTEKKFVGGSIPCEIDVFVRELKIGFEMNGLYWHCEKAGRGRSYHNDKTNSCEKAGIRLIQISDLEWIERNEQVKSYIQSLLGKNSRRVYARKCEVREVSKEETATFLESHHILGSVQNKAAYGLYLGQELLCLATMNSHHRTNNELVLNRYCGKTNVTVVGGLSRLSKHIKLKLGAFTTFIDRRWSNGTSWEAVGYTRIHQLGPDYMYYDIRGHKTVSKQSRMKRSVSTPAGMTEREHAIQDGLSRVWDCGKIKLQY